ncbi:hypothetical protein GCM10010442_76280 [Kitasatospora kifunensis]
MLMVFVALVPLGAVVGVVVVLIVCLGVRVLAVAGHRGRLLNAGCGQGLVPCREVNRISDEDPKAALVTVVVPLSAGVITPLTVISSELARLCRSVDIAFIRLPIHFLV